MNQLATKDQSAMSAGTRSFSLNPQSIEQAIQLAEMMSRSNLVPKDYIGNSGNILVAMQWGMELGLQPLQAMQNIAVINGRPSMWGDAVLAIVLSHPSCEDIVEQYEGTPDSDNFAAVCIAKRKGRSEKIGRFSLADAKRAGLIGKAGPWTQYRDRMMKMRARAFALRDQFADVLRGMAVAEEVMDMGVAERVDDKMAEAVTQATKTTEQELVTSLPAYTNQQVSDNSAAWQKHINAAPEKADAATSQIISMIKTKYTLSAAQEAAIKKLKNMTFDAETGEIIEENGNV